MGAVDGEARAALGSEAIDARARSTVFVLGLMSPGEKQQPSCQHILRHYHCPKTCQLVNARGLHRRKNVRASATQIVSFNLTAGNQILGAIGRGVILLSNANVPFTKASKRRMPEGLSSGLDQKSSIVRGCVVEMQCRC